MTKTTDENTTATDTTAVEPKAQGYVPVSLDEPIVRGTTKITTITLRRPNSGSLRGLNLTDVAQMNVTALQRLLPRISDPILTEADVAAMDPADLVKCGMEVAGFLLSKEDRQAFQ